MARNYFPTAGIAAVITVSVATVALFSQGGQPQAELTTPELALLLPAKGLSAGMVIRADVAQGGIAKSPTASSLTNFDLWIRGLRRNLSELRRTPAGQAATPEHLLADFISRNRAAGWVLSPSTVGVETLRHPQASHCEASLRRRINADVQGRSVFTLVSDLARHATDAKVPGGFLGSCASPNQSVSEPVTIRRGATLEEGLNEVAAKFGATVWAAVEGENADCALGLLQPSTQQNEICIVAITPRLSSVQR